MHIDSDDIGQVEERKKEAYTALKQKITANIKVANAKTVQKRSIDSKSYADFLREAEQAIQDEKVSPPLPASTSTGKQFQKTYEVENRSLDAFRHHFETQLAIAQSHYLLAEDSANETETIGRVALGASSLTGSLTAALPMQLLPQDYITEVTWTGETSQTSLLTGLMNLSLIDKADFAYAMPNQVAKYRELESKILDKITPENQEKVMRENIAPKRYADFFQEAQGGNK